MARITINGVSLDPVADSHALGLAGLVSADASTSDYILIQTRAPLAQDQRDQLANMGVVIHEYVSDNTYQCSYKASDLAQLRALPYVAWVDVYLRGFKIAPALRSSAGNATTHILPVTGAPLHSNKPQTVDIVFHEDVDPGSDAIRTAVAQAGRLDKDTLVSDRKKIRVTVQEKYLDDIAAIDAVRVIQPVPEVKLRNNVARPILNAHVLVNGTTYQGDGQVVAVADTGFDQGSTTAPHPAFTGRVAKLYALGRPNKPADDPDGHGTHVCGSVLGDGNSATMGGAIQGTAPRARLVVQSLIGPSGGLSGIPSDLGDLFGPPYHNDGARVHTNSWGAVTPGLPYDQSSREIDDFVWNNPDLVICFAAGNDGTDGDGDGIVDPAEVGSQAAAKNCITVGASESVRREVNPTFNTYGSLRPGDFPKPPIHDDPMADNSDGMAAFSNRGPTQEGRFKPDVVAPGTSILSTHSRNAPAAKATFGTSSDPLYFFDSGTSMATPLVAGCVAVLRETLVKNGMATPSASLIKALMINGAVELHGQYSPSEAGPSFNNSSGFGRVSLLGSVILPGPNPDGGLGEGGPLKQGDENTFTVDIPSQPPGVHSVAVGVGTTALGATFKITLVWTDPPGDRLQNDLDLIVIAANGAERHGNTGTAASFDRSNNVEQVVWTNMPPGPAKIVVRAFHVTRFPQPYSYAWRIS
jgi:serine protease AprX